MKSFTKKIVRRSLCVMGAVAVCALGIRTALHRSQANAPDIVAASANADSPVIVLDAGHGEST